MILIALCFACHLFINYISLFLGQIFLFITIKTGKTIQWLIKLAESTYQENTGYREKLVLSQMLLTRKLLLMSASVKLLKSQTKNTGYKKYYSFPQKLRTVILYLIFLPDKQEIERHLTHKLETLKHYITLIRTNGLFSLFQRPQYKRVPHNKKDIQIVRLIRQIHDSNPAWGKR